MDTFIILMSSETRYVVCFKDDIALFAEIERGRPSTAMSCSEREMVLPSARGWGSLWTRVRDGDHPSALAGWVTPRLIIAVPLIIVVYPRCFVG